MLSDYPGTWLAAVAVALVPALIRFIEDRALARRLDDPLLPERLLARRRRAYSVFLVTGVVLGMLWPRWLLWLLPVLYLANATAGFPFRKRLYEETWSFAAYLWFFTRIALSSFTFWIGVGCLPWSRGLFGTPPLLVPIAAGLTLLAWDRWSAALLRVLFRTQPVRDPVLLDAFDRLVAQCHLAPPRFEYIDLGGGSVANAVALPSLGGSSVIFTAPLLARLDRDEIVAICAHELAHLEYYDARRLRQFRAINTVLIVLGIALATLLPPRWSSLVAPFWAVSLLCALVWRAKDRQRNETASDRRAVELTGLPEALARGLAKLYAFARLPRRFDAAFEQRATHPSLARRIRDIHAAAGSTAPPLPQAQTFADAANGSYVTFGAATVDWVQPGTAEHRLNYGALTELRLVTARGAAVRLLAVDNTGRRWELPIAQNDVGRLQNVLDQVDVHIAGGARPPRVARSAVTLVVMFAVAAAALLGQFATALVALLALRAPSTRMIAAAGVAAFAGAAIIVRDGRSMEIAMLLAASGLAMCAIAYARRGEGPEPHTRLAIAALAVATILTVVLLFSFGTAPFRVHQAARAFPGAAVLLFASAAVMRLGANRGVLKRVALTIALAATVTVVLGSDVFLEGAVSDPLLVRAPVIPLTRVSGAPRVSFSLPFDAVEVTLSPRGESIVAWRDEEDASNDDDEWTGMAGRIGEPLTRIPFNDAVFTADDRLLGVRFVDEGAELSEGPVRGLATWHAHADGISSGRLAYDAQTRAWRLTGFDRRHRPVRIDGELGATTMQTTRWARDADSTSWAVETAGGVALAFDKHYTPTWVPLEFTRWLSVFAPYDTTAELRRVAADGGTAAAATSLLDVTCEPGIMPDHLVCAAFDGTRTRLAAVPVASGAVLPLGVLDGRFATYAVHGHAGWLTGWLHASPIAIRIDSLDGVIAPRLGPPFPTAIGADDRAIAVVRNTVGGSTVDVYLR